VPLFEITGLMMNTTSFIEFSERTLSVFQSILLEPSCFHIPVF
jgi:hypothetical protein